MESKGAKLRAEAWVVESGRGILFGTPQETYLGTVAGEDWEALVEEAEALRNGEAGLLELRELRGTNGVETLEVFAGERRLGIVVGDLFEILPRAYRLYRKSGVQGLYQIRVRSRCNGHQDDCV
ncbi:MAG: hypothetical protein ACE5JP_04110 [Candidatus Bipolaricaulia bacterium]